jgi:hypothetical protein
MPSAPQSRAGAPPVCAPWTELENHLKKARRSILAQIRNYPPPIAACDQQFNYLLEQRDRIAGALSRLASVRRQVRRRRVISRRLSISFTRPTASLTD